MILDEETYLKHYGVLRRSGRYPWGSGSTENVRNRSFLDYVQDMRNQGMSDVDICKGVGITTTQLRAATTIARNQQQQAKINQVDKLAAKGYSNVAIGQRMGLNESSVRALRAPGAKEKADILLSVANSLKDQVAQKTYVDVGTGVEIGMGISDTKLSAAVALLREQGYEVHSVPVSQQGTGHNTTVKVLAPPGTTWSDVARNKAQIQQVTSYSDDGGRTNFGIMPPLSIHPDRVGINYKESGGAAADGVIFVRPGVKDVSLDGAQYAQVRVTVANSHYIKGMAMYKEGLPEGQDLVFNTNKSDTGNKLDALKPLKTHQDGSPDLDNPYGAQINRQIGDPIPGQPKSKKLTSVMNLVNEEGDWGKWSKNLSSQMLSKQSPQLAKTQLDMTFENRQRELKDIKALTNPEVRKKLLQEFSDSTDRAAIQLKAAPLSGQATHVILPISSMPPTQIYAPNYKNGERVVLIRFPHGGTFEIPDLVVNNNQPEAKRLLKDAKDAVGIHHSVAERLSGADFDGDTVLVIPNSSNKVKVTPALEGLKGFDPRSSYPKYEGMKVMTSGRTQSEMGNISNLITDMTIKKASTEEVARAVRHSMVVIDAAKHELDYKRSADENGIKALKEKYQKQSDGSSGAATLISRARSRASVEDRKVRSASKGGPIDRETGRIVLEPTGRTSVGRDGVERPKLIRSVKLAETDDAHTLSSGTPMERLYADHSNRLKNLSNEARLELINTPSLKYSKSAKKTYSAEVATLNSKLALAQRNAPLERQAQIVAGTIVKARKDANPDMDETSYKKVKAQALAEARVRTGAKKQQIKIEDKEWEAIQAGAITGSKLKDILSNADNERVRELATPRRETLMTPTRITRAQAMFAFGATRAEVASALGVSLTTLDQVTDASINEGQ